MHSDEQLAADAQQGNAEAYAELVTRYQQRLFRFLQTRCASRADAEDALQEAFVDAWRYLHSYNSRWRFSTWLYRIALRRAARQRGDVAAGEQEQVDDSADPLAVCMAADERENLWRTARHLLSEDAVTALWLHSVEGMAVKDIARTLQRSLPWTKVSLMRSRRRLRTAMTAQEAGRPESEAYG
ncbi:MAG: sigma-70 family RNA polymerase sigma factor [Woeseia sp.]